MLFCQVVDLAEPDTVLAGTCAPKHGRAAHEPAIQVLDFGKLVGSLGLKMKFR